jgi:hypothetical protein
MLIELSADALEQGQRMFLPDAWSIAALGFFKGNSSVGVFGDASTCTIDLIRKSSINSLPSGTAALSPLE